MKKPRSAPTARALPSPPSSAPDDTVLLAVSGMSPAILTETVWALAHESPPTLPSRVVVVTTARGAADLARQLFTPGAAAAGGAGTVWESLRAALAAEGLPVAGRLLFGTTGEDVRVFTRPDDAGRNQPLEDIRTPADNEAAADFLLEVVRGFTENADVRLVASLAGGRKTMGALLYACFTLVGRETDRLTHVLVEPPFDAPGALEPPFFFPGQPAGELRHLRPHAAPVQPDAGPAEPLRAADARVELADVPFVPLRNLFTRDLGRLPGRFSGLVARCRRDVRARAVDAPTLEVHRASRQVRVGGGLPLTLAARQQTVLLYFAERLRDGKGPHSGYGDAADGVEAYRQRLREAAGEDFSDWRRSETKMVQAYDEEQLIRVLSDLRTTLRRAGAEAAVLAERLPAKGRCALDLPAGRVRVVD